MSSEFKDKPERYRDDYPEVGSVHRHYTGERKVLGYRFDDVAWQRPGGGPVFFLWLPNWRRWKKKAEEWCARVEKNSKKHAHDRRCGEALSGVPDPAALLGEVRTTVSAMVQALRQIADGPGLIAQHGDALEAGLALLQRLPGGGE